MIKTVFFDIGGVLLEIDPERTVRYWSEYSGIPFEAVKKNFPHEAHHRYERGLLSDHEFFKTVKKALPQPNRLQESDFWRGWTLLLGAETGAATLLSQLVRVLPVWLLSNTNPRHIRDGVQHRFSFFRTVTGAIYSYQAGARKPEPQIYFKALEVTGSRAEESLFIDDVQVNVDQARALGFHTIRFTSVDNLHEELVKLGFSLTRSGKILPVTE